MRRAGLVTGGLLVLAYRITSPAAPPSPPRSLVIITLDTTRADRLPAYGFSAVATPALDRLVNESVVFDSAESVAPLTLTAHTSLFTGLYPPHHAVRDNTAAPLDTRHPTLAELLRTRGFRTAAFVGSIVLRADRGLSRGFDVYHDGAGLRRRSGEQVIRDACDWIATLDTRPFFLWVHLYDTHAPQSLPVEYRSEYGDRYEGGIAYVDSQIAALLDSLRRKNALERSMIVVAGDHGESLGEHGEQEHGIFLYEAALHVPLIIRMPGVARRRVGSVTSLVDVLPTVLAVFGVPAPQAIDGVTLVPALLGRTMPERFVYAESMYAARFGWSPLRMVRDDQLKYIAAPRPELYDLGVDPFEQHDLSARRPWTLAALQARLRAFAIDERGDTETSRVPEERRRALAALGYVSTGPAAPRPLVGAIDPKDVIQAYNDARRHPAR